MHLDGFLSYDERPQPDDVPHAKAPRLGLSVVDRSHHGPRDCLPRHLQVRHRRQQPPAVDAVPGQEELLPRERRAESLLAKVRGVLMNQWMQAGPGASTRRRLRRHPVALPGEGVCRYTGPPRRTGHIEPCPVELDALDPQRRELRRVSARDARLDLWSRLALGCCPGSRPSWLRVAAVAIEYRPVPGDVGVQCRHQFFRAPDDERDSLLHGLAADLQRVRHFRQTRPGDEIAAADPGFEELEQPSRLLDQPFIVPRRQRDQALAILRLGVVSGARVLLDDSMRVGAAETERAHACTPRQHASPIVPPGRPDLVSLDDVEGAVGQIDVGIESLEIERRRDRAVLDGHQDLDQSCQSRRALQMPDIGLDGSESALRLPRPGLTARPIQAPERLDQATDLDRVAEPGAGAVRLDIVHGFGRDVRGLPGGFDDRRLRLRFRRR